MKDSEFALQLFNKMIDTKMLVPGDHIETLEPGLDFIRTELANHIAMEKAADKDMAVALDNLTSRGFIHNTYEDFYGNTFRLVQSSSVEYEQVWIFVDKEPAGLLFTVKQLRQLYKEAKRIAKGKIKK